MVDHCLGAAPKEGCGLFAVDGRQVARVYLTANAEASPTGYTVPPEDHFAALEDAEANGWELGGAFHSHPTGSARPSMVDVVGALDPEWVHVIVGLRREPVVRAWRIRDQLIDEVILT